MKKNTKIALAGSVAILLGIGAITSGSESDPQSPPVSVEVTTSPTANLVKPTVTKSSLPARKTKKPSKKPTTSPPVDLGAEPTTKTYYENCTELRKDYPNGVSSAHPAYDSGMDRDDDGRACERN